MNITGALKQQELKLSIMTAVWDIQDSICRIGGISVFRIADEDIPLLLEMLDKLCDHVNRFAPHTWPTAEQLKYNPKGWSFTAKHVCYAERPVFIRYNYESDKISWDSKDFNYSELDHLMMQFVVAKLNQLFGE